MDCERDVEPWRRRMVVRKDGILKRPFFPPLLYNPV